MKTISTNFHQNFSFLNSENSENSLSSLVRSRCSPSAVVRKSLRPAKLSWERCWESERMKVSWERRKASVRANRRASKEWKVVGKSEMCFSYNFNVALSCNVINYWMVLHDDVKTANDNWDGWGGSERMWECQKIFSSAGNVTLTYIAYIYAAKSAECAIKNEC